MPYLLTWQIPDKVLCLKLTGQVSLNEFMEISEDIHKWLDEQCNIHKIVLLIDIFEAIQIPRQLSQMTTSQSYAERDEFTSILVVGNSKSLRLILLLTFSTVQTMLYFSNSYEHSAEMLNVLIKNN